MQTLDDGDVLVSGCDGCPLAVLQGVRIRCSHDWAAGESAHVSEVKGSFALVGCPLLSRDEISLRFKRVSSSMSPHGYK